ncbi:MAG: hypothetical protein JW841_11520 [Deltaproteobacteria bacterium]|nr:hypothetical protein [Deltaproteobacteria bacterium]
MLLKARLKKFLCVYSVIQLLNILVQKNAYATQAVSANAGALSKVDKIFVYHQPNSHNCIDLLSPECTSADFINDLPISDIWPTIPLQCSAIINPINKLLR